MARHGRRVKPAAHARCSPSPIAFLLAAGHGARDPRIAFWWADRMVRTPRPLEEKMTLFWHGHFATSEESSATIERYSCSSKRCGPVPPAISASFGGCRQGPGHAGVLDAAQNVKGAPNENFWPRGDGTVHHGVGNYTEDDIREAARAFTGWGNDDLRFVFDPEKHDAGPKHFLGRTGNFGGEDILAHHPRAEADGNLHRQQALPLLRPRGGLAALAERLGDLCCAATTMRSRRS